MCSLKRRRFLECLKVDTERITVDHLTYWVPGRVVYLAYCAGLVPDGGRVQAAGGSNV